MTIVPETPGVEATQQQRFLEAERDARRALCRASQGLKLAAAEGDAHWRLEPLAAMVAALVAAVRYAEEARRLFPVVAAPPAAAPAV